MTVTVPDDVWAAYVAARDAYDAVAEKVTPLYSGGNALTVEAASAALVLLRAQVALARAAVSR